MTEVTRQLRRGAGRERQAERGSTERRPTERRPTERRPTESVRPTCGGSSCLAGSRLGVDSSSGEMSALHTHDDTGLVHVESPDPNGRYVLGQLFNEWNVALDATRLGGLTVGPSTRLRTFVNGVEFPSNPAALPLRERQQIALVYDPANAPVTPPASYDFRNA